MKEISLGKRTKISQAQQHMILAVFGASIFLGAAIAVVMNSANKISFNAKVIEAEDKSIISFSNTIKNIGICKKPSGSVYTDEELKKCDPNSTDASEVPGTLRANILESLASNAALNATPKGNISACINPDTNKDYTYKELEQMYKDAVTDEQLATATNLIKTCSALRIIPDALPATENTEALLSSVNKIFLDSGTEPESLAPSDDNGGGEGGIASFGTNLYTLGVTLSLDQVDVGTLSKILVNTERSIRDFDFRSITLEWKGDAVEFSSRATAYYMGKPFLGISDNTLKPGGK